MGRIKGQKHSGTRKEYGIRTVYFKEDTLKNVNSIFRLINTNNLTEVVRVAITAYLKQLETKNEINEEYAKLMKEQV